jgi:hypothetical protein
MLYGYLNFFLKTFNLVFRIFQNQIIVNSNSLKTQNQIILHLSNFKSLKNLQFVKINNYMIGYLIFSKKMKNVIIYHNRIFYFCKNDSQES